MKSTMVPFPDTGRDPDSRATRTGEMFGVKLASEAGVRMVVARMNVKMAPGRILMMLALFAAPALARASDTAVAAGGMAGAQALAFQDLAFAVVPPKQIEPEGASAPQPAYGEQIPERVRDLDGKRIRIRGYMIPTLLEDEGVREFIIVASPMMCCFGQTPEIYEYMMVRMVGDPSPMRENMPTVYEGTLRVGDVYEHGYWAGIFVLECDKVEEE